MTKSRAESKQSNPWVQGLKATEALIVRTAISPTDSRPRSLLWEIRIFQRKKSPCVAEGEEKARYPQGLECKVGMVIIADSAITDQGQRIIGVQVR